ncbi:MAG: acyltransferase [Lachnospiraceae bacterium]|nr:acyltransferase [Lachnospiraceae bacterium]
MKETTISIMKCLAIVGVVVGHCGLSRWTEAFVNQWHLATFFFVAGMCFKDKYILQPKMYIKRRIKSLYVPFVEFGLLFLVIHNILYVIHCAGIEYTIHDIGQELFNLTIGLTSNEPLMGAMWFCPALLLTSIIMMLTRMFVCKWLYISGMSKSGGVMLPILIFLLGYTAIQLHFKSPYCIWQYMVLSFIMWMGYLFKHYVKTDTWNTNIHVIVTVTGFALITFATNYGFMARLQPASINKENIIALVLIPALAGLSIYCLSILLNRTKLRLALAYIGDHSFSIMALHFLAFKVVNFAQIEFYGYSVKCLVEFPVINYSSSWGWGLIYIVTGVALPLMLTYAYNTIKR